MKRFLAALLGLTFCTAAWANISNTASCAFTDVNGTAQPSVTSNNVMVTVTVPPTLMLTKSASPTTVAHGGQVTFTIAYQNTSTVQASSVVINDTVPTGSTLVSGSISNGGTLSGGTITWNLGTVAAGASGSVSFQVTAN